MIIARNFFISIMLTSFHATGLQKKKISRGNEKQTILARFSVNRVRIARLDLMTKSVKIKIYSL